MTNTPNLQLPYIDQNQSQKHVTHNVALRSLDAIVQLSVKSAVLTAPPGAPADGDRYIVAAGATGDWAGKELNIASYSAGAWLFFAPKKGWLAWDEAGSRALVWNALGWQDFATIAGLVTTTTINNNTLPGKLTILGLGGATADATNRLSVNSPAVLFNHDGASFRQTLNKNSAADDAGFVFQTSFSTRALFGALGSDDFSFKVSPDGSAFYTNFRGWKDLHGRTDVRDAHRKFWGRVNAHIGGGGGLIATGLTLTRTGTHSEGAYSAASFYTQIPRVLETSSASAGSSAAVNGAALALWRGNAPGFGGFYLRMRGAVDTFQSGCRMFMGLYSSASVIGNVNPSTLLNMVGVGFDSGDTQLQLMTNDGSGAATKTALGAGFPTTGAQDVYELILSAEPNDSVIKYRVERLNSGDAASGVISSDLPANTQFLTPHLWLNNGSTAASVTVAIIDLYFEVASLLGSRGAL